MQWLSAEAAQLLQAQKGLITRPQLLAHRLTAGQVESRVARGDLEVVHCGTYRMPYAPVPAGQPAMAAVLRCRPDAALTGVPVLGLLGVEGCGPDAYLTVLVAPRRRVQNVPFTVRPDATWWSERALVDGIPAVTATRALIDAALVLDDVSLRHIVDSARWLGLVSIERLRRRCERLSRHPGARRLLRLVGAGVFAQESDGERNLAGALVGIDPQPEWGVWIAADIRVDALWRDVRLVLEYDGRDHHTRERDRAHDEARAARIRALGYHLERITVADLRSPEALRARLLGIRRGLLAALTSART